MSTYLGLKNDQVISLEDLKLYFQSFAKPVSRHVLGQEWELFGVFRENGRPLPYKGERGIEAVLKHLAKQSGFDTIQDDSNVIGLVRGDTYVALEPGGQLELSAAPVGTVHEIEIQLKEFRKELQGLSEALNIAWLTVGFHPFASREDMGWVPKKRYEIMKDYLGARGRLAHDMMKRTCADQVNFDYSGEQDAMEKMRVIYAVTSLASAMFAHSSLAENKVNGFQTLRMAVWRETDPERTGLIQGLLRENSTFQDYLDYVLDTPMMFIIRQNRWVSMSGLSFRDFILRGFQEYRATFDDFELHLSTLFPEARLKHFIEIRGADSQRFSLIPAVTAFWKGLLYCEEALEAAWKLMRNFSWEEHLRFRLAMETQGPNALMGSAQGWDLARELCDISRQGLSRQGKRNPSGEDETLFLERFYQEVIVPKKTPAERLIEVWRENPSNLINYLGL